MSTRWYPLYQKGNPQLRIFLPNFWMKLVSPEDTAPKNVVQFHCSMEMTKHDIKNYLEKIYKIPVIKVNTRIKLGKFSRRNNLLIKDDDVKIAYVSLPRYESFEFPNISPESKDETKPEAEELEKSKEIIRERSKLNPGMPLWFN